MDDLRAKLNDFGGDLFKDLRDRRLLPLVIVLVVAIVAVPLLLGGGGGEQEPPPAPLAEVPGGAEELEAVVTAAGGGVRDFHRRLEGRPRNPFKQQYPGLVRAREDDDSGTGIDPDAVEGSSPSGSAATPPEIGELPEVGDSGEPQVPPNVEPRPPRRITRLVKMTIDVRVFHAGKRREIEAVEVPSPVPGEKTPLTRFIGASRDAKRASFVVSPAVVSTEGDGNCDPGRNDCQFLVLKPGESQYFRYGEKQKRYRLKLLAIHRELVDERGSSDGEGEDDPVAAEVG